MDPPPSFVHERLSVDSGYEESGELGCSPLQLQLGLRRGSRGGGDTVTYQGVSQPQPDQGELGLGDQDWLLKPLFRCNHCGVRYADNSQLVMHLKASHPAVTRMLRPQYSCAR